MTGRVVTSRLRLAPSSSSGRHRVGPLLSAPVVHASLFPSFSGPHFCSLISLPKIFPSLGCAGPQRIVLVSVTGLSAQVHLVSAQGARHLVLDFLRFCRARPLQHPKRNENSVTSSLIDTERNACLRQYHISRTSCLILGVYYQSRSQSVNQHLPIKSRFFSAYLDNSYSSSLCFHLLLFATSCWSPTFPPIKLQRDLLSPTLRR